MNSKLSKELQEFLDSGKPKGNASKGKSRRPTQVKSGSLPPVESSTEGEPYRVIHYYLRKGDTFAQITKDAREDRSRLSDSTLIYVHNHPRHQPCNYSSCRSY